MNDHINQTGNGNTANITNTNYALNNQKIYNINYEGIQKEHYTLVKWWIAMLAEVLAVISSIFGISSATNFNTTTFNITYGNQKYNFTPLMTILAFVFIIILVSIFLGYQTRVLSKLRKNRFTVTNFTKTGLLYDKTHKQCYKICLPLCPICNNKAKMSSIDGDISISCSVNPSQHKFDFDYTKLL